MRKQYTSWIKDPTEEKNHNVLPYINKDIPKVSARFWAIYDS